MSAADPLEDFEAGFTTSQSQRILAVKMSQSILSEPGMFEAASIRMTSMIKLADYLLDGKAEGL